MPGNSGTISDWMNMKKLILLLFIAIQILSAPVPKGTRYYIPIVIHHEYVAADRNHFLYQLNMTGIMLSDDIFRSNIASVNNILIYDSSNNVVRDKYAQIDVDNGYLVISWDAPATTAYDRIFYACVGAGINDANKSSTFSSNDYDHEWPIKEFSPDAQTDDVVGTYDMIVESNASIGHDGYFGKCAINTGVDGKIWMDNIVLPATITKSIEFLIYVDGYGNGGLGRIIQAWPCVIWVWSGAGENLRFTNDGFTDIINHPLSFHEWHHVIIVRTDVGGVYIYVDGNSSPGYSGGATANNEGFIVLNDYNEAFAFDGMISDIGIINGASALTYAQSRSNMLMAPNDFRTFGDGVYVNGNGYMSGMTWWPDYNRSYHRWNVGFR